MAPVNQSQKERLDALENRILSLTDYQKEPEIFSIDKSRLEITKYFLSSFFGLIIFSFIFCFIYNLCFIPWGDNLIKHGIKPLDITNILPLITTTLGTGLGFIMGYYFKDK